MPTTPSNHAPVQLMPPYPWQQTLWDNFITWDSQGRLAHALLIAGPEGLGGLALAKAMAQFLLCNAPRDSVACGKCRGCQLMAGQSHPDLLLVEPEASSTAIKIDQVRQVTEFIAKTAQQGGRKVVLLAPAEAMNINAANALLKSLEEPAGQTHLLVVSQEPSRLLATIRSRCTKLILTAPNEPDALAWLTQMGIPDAAQMLRHAGGEPLKVQRWFEKDFAAQQASMQKDLAAIASGNRSPMAIAKAWLEYLPVEVVDCLLMWVQDAVSVRQAGSHAPEADEKTANAVGCLTDVPLQLLFRYWDKLAHSKQEMLSKNNPNIELLLDELLMGWAALCRQAVPGRGEH